MKIKNIIFGMLTAAACISSGITVSADKITVKTDVYQPDEICGNVNIRSSKTDNVFVKIIKHTPETDVDEKGKSVGYAVYDTYINADYIHVSDIMVFPLEYNNYNYETQMHDGNYEIFIGVHKHLGSDDSNDIAWQKIEIVVGDTNYCGYTTNCTINVDIIENSQAEPSYTVSGKSPNKVYNMTFSSQNSIIGDADNNNSLGIGDAAFIAKMIAIGRVGELPAHADFNGDGRVSIKDAADIAKYIANRKNPTKQ